eukprot:6179955-Pleurochrysis_carterae.AAC.2
MGEGVSKAYGVAPRCYKLKTRVLPFGWFARVSRTGSAQRATAGRRCRAVTCVCASAAAWASEGVMVRNGFYYHRHIRQTNK